MKKKFLTICLCLLATGIAMATDTTLTPPTPTGPTTVIADNTNTGLPAMLSAGGITEATVLKTPTQPTALQANDYGINVATSPTERYQGSEVAIRNDNHFNQAELGMLPVTVAMDNHVLKLPILTLSANRDEGTVAGGALTVAKIPLMTGLVDLGTYCVS